MKTALKTHVVLLTILFSCIWHPGLAQNLLDPSTHPKFDVALPVPAKIDATGGGLFALRMEETVQWLGLRNPAGDTLTTTVWGYGPEGAVTFPGPTIEAWQGVPVDIHWTNHLPMQHLLPVDTTVHMAHPIHGGVPAVVHLHGGHTESASDGLPDAWFTPGFEEKGRAFVKELYHYDNDNEASTLWYHDHALGVTRLNVYAGLAGFYLMRDDQEAGLRSSNILPDKAFEREIVFQDRMFTTGGALHFPSEPEAPGWPEPTALPEFFGDFILVNGVAWPYMEVEPRKYRLRLLNGSDSRFYIIRFGDQMEFLQIATDNGLLENPVALEELLLAPGERAEIILDFSGMPSGTAVTCTNRGPDEPYRGLNPDGSLNDGEGGQLDPAEPESTGQLMKFVVSLPLSNIPDASVSTSTTLRPPIEPLDTVGVKLRKLVLFEGEDAFGRLRPQLGIYDSESPLNGSLLYEEEPTEVVDLDATEIWEVYNATEDAHPIHLHLVAYQILNRQDYVGEADVVGTDPLVGGTKQVLNLEGLSGAPEAPAPNEKGWKDTGVMLPGQVTRIVARFDREGEYVWHCHILSHEDHEMMRSLVVRYDVGTDAPLAEGEARIVDIRPNPSGGQTQIAFQVPEVDDWNLEVFDAQGQLVRTIWTGRIEAGDQTRNWDGNMLSGQPAPAGIYYCRLSNGRKASVAKLVRLR